MLCLHHTTFTAQNKHTASIFGRIIFIPFVHITGSFVLNGNGIFSTDSEKRRRSDAFVAGMVILQFHE